MQIYDNGIAIIFQVPTKNARDVFVNNVRMLKDILKLDYRQIAYASDSSLMQMDEDK